MQNTDNMIYSRSIPDKIKYLIFDLDGTFYPLKRIGWNMLLLLLRHPRATVNIYKARKIVRNINWEDESFTNRRIFLKRQAACAGVSPEYFEKYFYRNIHRRVFPLKPFDGVKSTLALLKEKVYKMYVYSDFPIDGKMEELGIASYFDGIYSSEDSGFLKPDARGFEFLKTHIAGLSSDNALFIGDREETDVSFAKNCGMSYAVVGQTWKWSDK